MVTHYDVVIIGSGFGGSIPALRIAQRGKKVVVLERGYRLQDKDFKQDWSMRNLNRFYFMINAPDYSIIYRTSNLVGGGSMLYSGLSPRMPSDAFNFVDNTGYPVWPVEVNRQVLDPYYDVVEQNMQITQAGWNNVPKSGGIFAQMLNNMGLTADRGRYPYVNCRQCGFCEVGCMFGVKQHLLHNYIPQAESVGAEFLDGCKARQVYPSSGGYTVQYIDMYQNTNEVEGEIVILAAGSPFTAEILLRSQQNSLLTGLSDQVGKNFNNNGNFPVHFGLPSSGFPYFNTYEGMLSAGVITYAFWNQYQMTIESGTSPAGIFAGNIIQKQGMQTWGLAYKHFAKAYYPQRIIGGTVMGLLTGEGEVNLSNDSPVINLPMTTGLLNYQQKVVNILNSIAKANNAELFVPSPDVPFGDAHLLGTCRMGDDPARSVLDPNCQVRGYPGLFVTDSSAIPGGTGINPALTISANAERVANYIVSLV
ncbi:MAG: GMC family oxidoreductase [Deltaproteobacteria bacterium]|nr:GMC family oxidoreductase [Deltaproteobacteria bacterium]